MKILPNRNNERSNQMLETCFDTFCEYGLENTGMEKLSRACGISNATLIYHLGNKDNIIIESTAYCMAKVEQDFMAKAPGSPAEIERFLSEMPYITAKEHGAKYRFMYQVYSSPKYREHGKEFFRGVNKRYRSYAEQLAPKLGFSVEFVQGVIHLFVRACVHYALFEDEEYLNLQLAVIRQTLMLYQKANQTIRNEEEII